LIDSEKIIRWFDFQASFYRLWRDDYDGPLVREALALLREEGGARTVLDAACGTGLFSIGIAMAEPGWRIDGIDASSGMLAVARRQASRKGLGTIAWHHGDVTALPFDDSAFDAVVAAGLIPCLNESVQALAEFHRVLRRGGRLVSIEFDRAAMSWGMGIFIRIMILGYKTVSWLMPRFRFADGWSIEKSTIDSERYERDLSAAGLEIISVSRVASHVVYCARRPNDSM
jgi:ubiquinone/menaquinone biosynthesis C-methylase UbiE